MDHSTHNKIVSFIWSIADDCLRDVFVRGKYRDVILPMFVLRRLDCLLEPSKDKVLEEVRFQREDADMADLEHFTPREVINLMTNLVFIPVKDQLPNPLTIYDPACGSGGMLTESQDFVTDAEGEIKAKVGVFLYGKEINPETYAICKSDMMIKGNDPENIKFGSTLATNDFSGTRFDFMLSNPPYGKSWKGDQKGIIEGKEVLDHRFQVNLSDYTGESHDFYPAIPRSSDGQLLFLMEMVDKMKRRSDLSDKNATRFSGSRIASVHNGSALFTGDAGSGESNIRRHIIESDYLEAIIQLPNNLFYNTGITTYVWLLSNHKTEKRQGKVQLIDASNLYQKLRKNLGEKNCEFTAEHIQQITQLYLSLADDGISKVFDNRDFGYYKVTVERPLRLAAQFSPERIATLRFTPGMQEIMEWVYGKYGDEVYTDLKSHTEAIENHLEREEITLSPKNRKELLAQTTWQAQRDIMLAAQQIAAKVGPDEHLDFNLFETMVDEACASLKLKLSTPERKQVLNAVSWRDPRAAKVIKKQHKLSGSKLKDLLSELQTTAERLGDYGYWPSAKTGEFIEYEPDSELRDTENVPLAKSKTPTASSVIHEYFIREVRPHVDEAWIALDKTVIGYEISFNKYFYQHKPLRSLEEVTAEILALEAETDGLLKQLVSFVSGAK